MQTIAITNVRNERVSNVQSASSTEWIKRVLTASEANRFGLVATLILLQVSIAGFNVVIPPMVGASVWLMAPGITMAFLSNALALAQMKMKWVLLGFGLSILINAAISIYCSVLLFN
ncbi:MAG TPA: hypothetical protein VLJ41_07390 [Segetibacter sp.]|nr:hypothetical protein [Segetibacter sp.]